MIPSRSGTRQRSPRLLVSDTFKSSLRGHEYPCMDREIWELQQLSPCQDLCVPSVTTVTYSNAFTSTELVAITTRLRNSSLNLALVERLYDRLNELRIPSFLGTRVTLPCIIFKIGPPSVSWDGSEQVFRAQTTALGIVGIRTKEDSFGLESLCLVYP